MKLEPYGGQRIADRFEIQDLTHRWCRAVDRLDRQGMLDTFHPGAIDNHGHYCGPIEGLVDWVMQRHQAISFSSHFVGNLLVEFIDEDRALVECSLRTIQHYPAHAMRQLAEMTGGSPRESATAMNLFSSSRYMDIVERRGGPWRVAQRTLIQEWKDVQPVAAQALQPRDGWVIGRRDGNDAIEVARRELGLV
jgi:hypothetical protein